MKPPDPGSSETEMGSLVSDFCLRGHTLHRRPRPHHSGKAVLSRDGSFPNATYSGDIFKATRSACTPRGLAFLWLLPSRAPNTREGAGRAQAKPSADKNNTFLPNYQLPASPINERFLRSRQANKVLLNSRPRSPLPTGEARKLMLGEPRD